MSPFFVWDSASAQKYSAFSGSVPSDLPAYELVFDLLDFSGKRVLDFGCFEGSISKKLLESGAGEVVGIDNSSRHIETAQKRYAGVPGLSFAHVPEAQPLPEYGLFDAVCMTFVHPTIGDFKTLAFQIKKLADVMRVGAPLVLLGLHPKSFNPSFSFCFYRHQLPEGHAYEDALPFPNELRLPDEQRVRFYDYCWTEDTLLSLLAQEFDTRSFELRRELPGAEGTLLNESVERIARATNITWKDEWRAPLYQVIRATKR